MTTENIPSRHYEALRATSPFESFSLCHFHRRYGHPGRSSILPRTPTSANIETDQLKCNTPHTSTGGINIKIIIFLVILGAAACLLECPKDDCEKMHGTKTVAISQNNCNQHPIIASIISQLPSYNMTTTPLTPDEVDKLKVADLRTELENRGLDSSGIKKDLAARLKMSVTEEIAAVAAAEAAAAAAAAASTTPSNVSPTGTENGGNNNNDINDLLSDLQSGKDRGDDEDEEMEEGGSNSPNPRNKKKSKKDKSEKKNGKKSSSKRDRDSTRTNSILRNSTRPAVVYKEREVIVEAMITLTTANKHAEFHSAFKGLYENFLIVDNQVEIPLWEYRSRNKPIQSVAQIPENFTSFSAYVEISQGGAAFDEQKQRKKAEQRERNQGKGGKKKERRNTATEGNEPFNIPVFFQFRINSMESVDVIMNRVGHEWGKRGGGFLRKKKLQVGTLESVALMLYVHTDQAQEAIVNDFKESCREARDLAAMTGDLPPEFITADVPAIGIRFLVPRIPGANTQAKGSYTNEMKRAQKAIHIECDVKERPLFKFLLSYGKEKGCFLDKFGERPLITEPLGWDPYKSDAYRLLRAANDHTAYVSCTTIAGLEGVVNIDAKATIQAKEGEEAVSFTFRKVLRNLVKYKEGNKEGNLIAEARQTGVGGKVEVVHPDTPAAEKEVEMMNKNVAAYVFHTLLAEGVDEKFLQDLLRRSCLSSLYQDIPNCTWDAKTRVLTTPHEAEQDALAASLTAQPWFVNLNETLGNKDSKKTKKVDPDFAFRLGSSRSVQTIHGENDGKYDKTVGKDTIDLNKVRASKSNNKEVIDVDEDGDSVSNLSNMSKGQLMDKIRRMKSNVGDQPSQKSAGSKSYQDDSSDDEASSSDESDSDDDSMSGSEASKASGANQKTDGAAGGA